MTVLPVMEPDRASAIAQAIQLARKGDIVLVAGKGHENYQEAAGVRAPFSDAAVAEDVLANWVVYAGPYNRRASDNLATKADVATDDMAEKS
jgi:regulator of RNase E activity RraA